MNTERLPCWSDEGDEGFSRAACGESFVGVVMFLTNTVMPAGSLVFGFLTDGLTYDIKWDEVKAASAAAKPVAAPGTEPEPPAATTSSSSSSAASTAPDPAVSSAEPKRRVEYDMPKPDFSSTMSALDALVGATDEEKQREAEAKADDAAFAEAERARREKEGASTSADDSDGVTLTVAPGVLEAIEQAEKARKSGSVPEDVEAFGGESKGETEGAKEG